MKEKKPLIDREGRLFGRVSVIDLVVALLVVVMAVALYVKDHRLDASSTGSASSTPIVFTAVRGQVEDYIVDAIHVGDMVYDLDNSSGGAIGVITDVEVSPSSQVTTTYRGEYIEAPYDGAKTVAITVACTGSVSDGRYSINRVYQLGVNANRNFYTPYALLSAFCVTEIHAEDAA